MGTLGSGKKKCPAGWQSAFAFDLLSGWSPLQHAAYLVLMCVEQHWLCPARPLEGLLGRCTGLRKTWALGGSPGFSAGVGRTDWFQSPPSEPDVQISRVWTFPRNTRRERPVLLATYTALSVCTYAWATTQETQALAAMVMALDVPPAAGT
jgi:hypothetical protein